MAHPEILWAQRSSDVDEEKNFIYLTVNLPDIHKDTVKYDLTPTKVTFKAVAGANPELTKEYACELDLYEEIVPDKSSKKLSSRAFDLKLQKKEKQAEFWPRLTKTKNRLVKTNFERWVDEDEQEGAAADDDMDFEGMGGGGGGGFGGGGFGGGGSEFGDLQRMMANMGNEGSSGPATNLSHEVDENEGSDDDEGPPPLEDAEHSA